MNEQSSAADWTESAYSLFKAHRVDMIAFVPDGGLKRLIELCQHDAEMRAVTLTTEEEGIAFAAGAFLGGKRAVLLMQSSGVGNCINMLSLPRICNMPLLALVTMRGEWGEFNPWQVPMGQNAQQLLEASGMIVYRVEAFADAYPTIEAAIMQAFQSRCRVTVLISQRLIGAKNFVRGDR